MATATQPQLPSNNGDPSWEVARLFPPQGHWNESDFFRIQTNRMAELVDGRLEILPMPTWLHQLIVDFLLTGLKNHLSESRVGGVALCAPLPVRLFPGTIREPDVLFVLPENIPEDLSGYPKKLDLAMEVVSSGPEARSRDYDHKRVDYAKAGITEYWIVDPEHALITVLTLDGKEYQVASENHAGQTASSLLLPGFEIAVDDVLQLGKR